jgi:DNA-binding MarR family transcriptional regulator
MISDLEDHLGYWLRFVSNHVSHAFALKLQAHDVTAAEWVILRELFARRNAAPSTIAGRIGMTRGAVTKLVDRLAAKALVVREESAGDRRYQVLALTPAGRRLVPALAALADRNDAEFFGHLEPAQRATFERLLKDVVQRHGFKTFPTT